MTDDFDDARHAWAVLNLDDAWEQGQAAAKEAMAAIEEKRPVPVSRTTAAVSILASPHIANWPPDARDWLAGLAPPRDLTTRFCTVDDCGLTTDGDLCWAHRKADT